MPVKLAILRQQRPNFFKPNCWTVEVYQRRCVSMHPARGDVQSAYTCLECRHTWSGVKEHNILEPSGFLCESRTDPKYGECMCIVWVVCILLCDCVMQRLLDFLGPMPLEHPMKVHDPAARCSSYPIPRGPRVAWRPLGITGKGAYPNINRIVNMTDIFLFFFFTRFLKFL